MPNLVTAGFLENSVWPQLDVLLVEDDSSDAELAIRELQRQHFARKIHVISDGAEAMDFVFCRGAYQDRSFRLPPKVILLDIKLAKIDGLQILAAIKKDARTRAIPVVIMTSSCEPADLVQSYRLGVNAFIQKPAAYDEFRTTIETISKFWLSANQLPPSQAFES